MEHNQAMYHNANEDTDFVRLAAWFLGPKGENRDELKKILIDILDQHAEWRRTYYPQDPPYISSDIKQRPEYQKQLKSIEKHVGNLSKKLRNSTPFFSSRYKGHMNWDISMPGLVGYFATMLFNPNNVAMEGSPVTTALEYEVGQEICQMIGYSKDEMLPWGHITCDGTVANIEALWASRNVKYHATALQSALKDNRLPHFENAEIYVPKEGKPKKVRELTSWELQNIQTDDILALLTKMNDETQHDGSVTKALSPYDIQHVGLYNVPAGKVFVPASRHYSWDKAAALLGIGSNNLSIVPLDGEGRMLVKRNTSLGGVKSLEESLEECRDKNIPVTMVVVVIGSTAEGAVDNLQQVLELRTKFSKEGLTFNVHADGAWGGYFRTMLPPKVSPAYDIAKSEVPFLKLSDYVESQLALLYHCDSVTIDPHKSGFIQYPAGSLCYRNGSIRHLLSFSAPVISTGEKDVSIGIYGIEGSKPGASVAATWLSHKVIGLHDRGYGRILGEANFTTKLIYTTLCTMADKDDPFIIAPYNFATPEDIEFLKTNVVGKSNTELRQKPEVIKRLSAIGPDLLINAFALNFKTPILIKDKQTRQVNKDITMVKKFLAALSADLNISGTIDSDQVTGNGVLRKRLFLIRSTLGDSHVQVTKRLKEQLGLDPSADELDYLVNTNMDPWPTATGFMDVFKIELRKSILRSIGAVIDGEGEADGTHGFIATEASANTIYGDHLPMFWMPEHQYHAIFKFKPIGGASEKRLVELMEKARTAGPLIFGNVKDKKLTLHELSKVDEFSADVFLGSLDNKQEGTIQLKVIDIIRMDHFDPAEKRPTEEKYLLYTNDQKNVAYMSHCMTEYPDFHHVVQLEKVPENMPSCLLDVGVEVFVSAKVELGKEYDVKFVSLEGRPDHVVIKIAKEIWYDKDMINMSH